MRYSVWKLAFQKGVPVLLLCEQADPPSLSLCVCVCVCVCVVGVCVCVVGGGFGSVLMCVHTCLQMGGCMLKLPSSRLCELQGEFVLVAIRNNQGA